MRRDNIIALKVYVYCCTVAVPKFRSLVRGLPFKTNDLNRNSPVAEFI